MVKELSVTQLNNYIKCVFDDEIILQRVFVHGEIFEFKVVGGNSYIVLKEDENIVNCVYFSSSVDYPLGVKVMADGMVRYHGKSGKLSFVISSLRLLGDGELIARQKELKNRLENEGVFANSRPLSPIIKNVALITSGDGAVIHDFLSILRPFEYVDVTVFSVRTQGVGAADEIVSAINAINLISKRRSFEHLPTNFSYFDENSDDFDGGNVDISAINSDFDVIVIARGGGSSTDLSEFNTEQLARTIFGSRVPIISAIGHEIDYTLCDFAADHRAGTPSIAAEMIATNNVVYLQRFERICGQIKSKISGLMQQKSRNLFMQAQRTVENSARLNDSAYKRCIGLTYEIQNNARKCVDSRRSRLLKLATKASITSNYMLQKKESAFKILCSKIDSQSPLKILSQGYCRVIKGKKNVSSCDQISADDSVNIVLADGRAEARIIESKKRK